MRFFIIAVLLVSFTLAGCSNVRVYTFAKERVDQKEAGNRGYITGTPPPKPIGPVKKRTLIGIDIEIPLLPGEEGYEPKSGGVIYADDVLMTPTGEGQDVVVYEEEVVVIEEVELDTNYIQIGRARVGKECRSRWSP